MLHRHGLKLTIAGLSAACGLVVEIVAGRLIAPYLGMSLYTWTAIISVVLAGFSIGHWIGGHIAERRRYEAIRLTAASLALAALSTAATLVLLRIAAPVLIALEFNAVVTSLAVALTLFFLPSLFVGIPSPVLTKIAIDQDPPHLIGRTIGGFYAVGAVGSIGGTLAAGYVFVSYLGATATLLAVAIVYLCLALLLIWSQRCAQPTRNAIATLTVIGLTAILLGVIGDKLRAFAEPCRIGSAYYCIRIVDQSAAVGAPARAMVLDHLGHGINVRDKPQTLVSPYVELHDILARIHSGRRSPFEVFFIGGGAYTLPRAWAAARRDAKLTVAEIDPEVTDIAARDLWLPKTGKITSIHADARVALARAPPQTFDIIVGDAFHDIVIPAHLVTKEFFAVVRSRLAGDGIYLMNVVDHRDRPRLALSILSAIKQSFDHVELWQANQTGRRATFVLAGLARPTPYPALPSRHSPGIRFVRIAQLRIDELAEALQPVMLTDDFAPVDRLIGVE